MKTILALLTLCAPMLHAQGKWVDIAPFPDPREEVMGEAANGKLYVFSGLIPLWHPAGLVYEYDPATNRWTKKKPMALPSHHVAFCEHDGKIYAFGGFVYPDPPAPAGWVPINNAWEYDPRNDSWKALAAMPTKRGAAVATEADGKIYVIGGATTAPGAKEPYINFTTRQKRGGNSGRVRSKNRYLAYAYTHAYATESHGRRNREWENLCHRRPCGSCFHFNCLRHFPGGSLQPGNRYMGTTRSPHANST
jgi:N-acetylneuraminic acid mutarotase